MAQGLWKLWKSGKLSIPLRSIPSFPQFPQFPQLRLLAISLRTKTEKPVSSTVYPALVARRLKQIVSGKPEGARYQNAKPPVLGGLFS